MEYLIIKHVWQLSFFIILYNDFRQYLCEVIQIELDFLLELGSEFWLLSSALVKHNCIT